MLDFPWLIVKHLGSHIGLACVRPALHIMLSAPRLFLAYHAWGLNISLT